MTNSTALRPARVDRSPFTGQRVHILAGLKMAPTARRPMFDEETWDLTGLVDVCVQVPPNVLTWDFTKIQDEGWRLVAREYLIAVLAPRHEHVLPLPLARRDELGLRGHLIRWSQAMSAFGVSS